MAVKLFSLFTAWPAAAHAEPQPAPLPAPFVIAFAAGTPELVPDGRQALAEAVAATRAFPAACVEVGAYLGASAAGTFYPLLGRVRALDIYGALVAAGVPAQSLSLKSEGEGSTYGDFESSLTSRVLLRLKPRPAAGCPRWPVAAAPGGDPADAMVQSGEQLVLYFAPQGTELSAGLEQVVAAFLARHAADPAYVLHIGGYANKKGAAVVNELVSHLRSAEVFAFVTQAGLAPARIRREWSGEEPPPAPVPASRRLIRTKSAARRRVDLTWVPPPPPPASAAVAAAPPEPPLPERPMVEDDYDVPLQIPIGFDGVLGLLTPPDPAMMATRAAAATALGKSFAYQYGAGLKYLFDHDAESSFGSELLLVRQVYRDTLRRNVRQDLSIRSWRLGFYDEFAGADLNFQAHYGVAWRKANAYAVSQPPPVGFQDSWSDRSLYLDGGLFFPITDEFKLTLNLSWYLNMRDIFANHWEGWRDDLNWGINTNVSWNLPAFGNTTRLPRPGEAVPTPPQTTVDVGLLEAEVEPPANLRSLIPPAREQGVLLRWLRPLGAEVAVKEQDFKASKESTQVQGTLTTQGLSVGAVYDWELTDHVAPVLHAGLTADEWHATATDSLTGAEQRSHGDAIGPYVMVGLAWRPLQHVRMEPFLEGSYMAAGLKGFAGGGGIVMAGSF